MRRRTLSARPCRLPAGPHPCLHSTDWNSMSEAEAAPDLQNTLYLDLKDGAW